jgi:alpha-tubulin suppressor-like RCC1 family protein
MSRIDAVCTVQLALFAASCALLGPACAPPRRASLGTECERNSDCDTPLVCRLGFCRNECATSADCGAGLACVLTGTFGDAHRFGACQLAAEQRCVLQSECPDGLVCRFNECTNACNEDRDCPGGAMCRVDPMGNACFDTASTPCTLDGECGSGEFCFDGVCRPQCLADRDCRNEHWCDTSRRPSPCLPPPRPARDAGPIDAPLDASPRIDAPLPSACSGPLTNVVSITASEDHVCALVSRGVNAVYCWGGPPSAAGSPADPQLCAGEIPALTGRGVSEVTAGGAHTCVRDGSNRVLCFGSNEESQLGRTTVGVEDAVPDLVMPSTSATELALGVFHTCASSAGTLLCWGRNAYDQLGTTPPSTPRVAMAPVTSRFFGSAITAGREHTCALDGSSIPFCWGSAFALGSAGPLRSASVVEAGRGHTCALLLDGTVACWGDNASGQLGDGTTTSSNARLVVPGLSGVTELSASGLSTCAVAGGEVWCWGWSYIRGDRSDGAAATAITAPERVDFGGRTVDELETGNGFACIRSDGSVYCLGDNPFGQLGDGTTRSRRSAVEVGIAP